LPNLDKGNGWELAIGNWQLADGNGNHRISTTPADIRDSAVSPIA